MEETFTVYKFIGIYDRQKDTEIMSLRHFLEHESSRYYVLDTKELFECSCLRFASKEMSLGDIHEAIAEGAVFFPITVACRKKDVLEYIKRGFKARFLRFTEYRRLLKAYEG